MIRLRWPTDYGVITQPFGARPEVYQLFGLPGHEGLDFQAPAGSNVYAAAGGTVSEVRLDDNIDLLKKPYGNQVRIRHSDGYETVYAHLSRVLVSRGEAVEAGRLIALAGSSGHSEGPHLHLTLKKQGATQSGATYFPYDIVDPTSYLEPFSPGPEIPLPDEPTLDVQVESPTVGYLNIRSGPSVNHERIARVDHGTILGAMEAEEVAQRKVGQEGQWLRVRLPDGRVGFAAAWYLILPPGAVVPLQLVVDSPDLPLRIRSGPGIGYAQIGQAAHGTLLAALDPETTVRERVGKYGQWLHVRASDGIEGYSAAWYLRLHEPGVPVDWGLAPAAVVEERRLVALDDLTRIRGIGPKTAATLRAVGIGLFMQIARADADTLRAVLVEAGQRGWAVETWAEQARRFLAVQAASAED